MNINGLQKLTLLDFPGRTACTVFLAGCDMKCPFCHNSELITGDAEILMDDEELLKFLKSRFGLLDGVAFTGGEPCLRRDLPDLMRKVKDLGYAIKLDTNGAHPDSIKAMLEEKLVDYIAMDIKNSPAEYPITCDLAYINMDAIYNSISMIMNSGINYEFRTTVIDQFHNEASFEAIGPMIKGAKQYFLQAFVDRDTVRFSGFTAPSPEKMQKYAEIVSPFVEKVEIRGMNL